MTGTGRSGQQDFVNAFLAIHRNLYGYVVSITRNLADAEEVFQKTSIVLWERWQERDPTREVLPWAIGIARNQARKYRAEKGLHREQLCEDAAEIVANAFERSSPGLDSRLEALQRCIEKLSLKQQKLLKRCYSDRSVGALQRVSEELNLTTNALYLQLRRLREVLHACIHRTLVTEKNS